MDDVLFLCVVGEFSMWLFLFVCGYVYGQLVYVVSSLSL